MRRPTVYIDMDGVIVDFDKALHDIFDLPEDFKFRKYFIEEQVQMSPAEVRGKLNSMTFTDWENLDPIQEGMEMVGRILQVTSDICFLSSPAAGAMSASGKVAWLEKNIPWASDKFILTRQKEKLAVGGDILIDDWGHNIEKWVKNGGSGLYVKTTYSDEYPNLNPRTQKEIGELLHTFFSGIRWMH